MRVGDSVALFTGDGRRIRGDDRAHRPARVVTLRVESPRCRRARKPVAGHARAVDHRRRHDGLGRAQGGRARRRGDRAAAGGAQPGMRRRSHGAPRRALAADRDRRVRAMRPQSRSRTIAPIVSFAQWIEAVDARRDPSRFSMPTRGRSLASTRRERRRRARSSSVRKAGSTREELRRARDARRRCPFISAARAARGNRGARGAGDVNALPATPHDAALIATVTALVPAISARSPATRMLQRTRSISIESTEPRHQRSANFLLRRWPTMTRSMRERLDHARDDVDRLAVLQMRRHRKAALGQRRRRLVQVGLHPRAIDRQRGLRHELAGQQVRRRIVQHADEVDLPSRRPASGASIHRRQGGFPGEPSNATRIFWYMAISRVCG